MGNFSDFSKTTTRCLKLYSEKRRFTCGKLVPPELERCAKEFARRQTHARKSFCAFFPFDLPFLLIPFFFFFFSFPRSMHRLLARPVCFWQPNSRRCTTALGRRPNVINFKSGHCFPLHLARCIEPKGLSREQRTDHLAVCIRSNVRLHSKWYKAVRILLLRRYARFGRFVFLTFTAVIVDIY